MRYYEFAMNGSTQFIKDNATVRLKDYDFDVPICAMNKYMYRNLKNGVSFLTYREDDNDTLFAIFSFDEGRNSLGDVYDYLLDILRSIFLIKKIKAAPREITANDFFEALIEARRRAFVWNYYSFVEITNLKLYDDFYKCSDRRLPFSFTERIIPECVVEEKAICDDSLIREFDNIESHENNSELSGNLVHYVISARSREASLAMTESLMQRLYKANRISTRRMVDITDIEPELFRGSNRIEEIVTNNFGGVIVVNLTEKFGYDPASYDMTAKYLENLVKKYRNKCLFVFTYNIDSPGFSYFVLPQLKKYVLPVMLREGFGDRKAAISYMSKLIKSSDYAQYAGQAREYMKLYPGKQFTQTDVLNAYEQFDAWCINKNILHAYDYDLSDEFLLDRDVHAKSSYDKLQRMVGLKLVKEQIDNIIAADIVEKERKKRMGGSYKASSMHMIFGGNPGSAKTTVAKLFAGIAKEKEILKSGAFVEKSGMDLDGFGCVYSIKRAFAAAKGGILFIDEAYAIKSDTAVTVLIQEMENKREEVIVILAGYNGRMQQFMELNEGLKSRIPYWIDFPDYNEDELTEIFKLMLKERGFSATDDVISEARYIFEKVRHTDNFGNGRYVRNFTERATLHQSVRLLAAGGDAGAIPKKELFLLTKEDICMLEEGLKDERKAGTALKELEEMIGLSSVKSVMKKAIASFKLKKYCMERGIHKDKASLHMVFTGNPGTAKTTVARLFAEIMKDEKVLPTGKFIEVGRADLIGEHVGSTAPKVKKRFREAQGGVLFIDEAYSLCDGYKDGFGDEAINTIVQEMENHREDVIVIFAGYPAQMNEFLDRNPGLFSRIAFRVEFEDYSVDELCAITRLMLSRKDMTITDDAMNKLRSIYEAASKSSDYGNGRFVRKIIEEAEMNVAQRISAMNEVEITTELITTIEECDVPETNTTKGTDKKPIGFCVA